VVFQIVGEMLAVQMLLQITIALSISVAAVITCIGIYIFALMVDSSVKVSSFNRSLQNDLDAHVQPGASAQESIDYLTSIGARAFSWTCPPDDACRSVEPGQLPDRIHGVLNTSTLTPKPERPYCTPWVYIDAYLDESQTVTKTQISIVCLF
jgi:hypothetical protein